jgi:hypothetical protein
VELVVEVLVDALVQLVAEQLLVLVVCMVVAVEVEGQIKLERQEVRAQFVSFGLDQLVNSLRLVLIILN